MPAASKQVSRSAASANKRDNAPVIDSDEPSSKSKDKSEVAVKKTISKRMKGDSNVSAGDFDDRFRYIIVVRAPFSSLYLCTC